MKEKALQDIELIMQEQNLTLDDVELYIRKKLSSKWIPGRFKQFDVLYVHGLSDDNRASFESCRHELKIGLFPFQIGNWRCYYLALKEDEILRQFVNEERLPTVDFFQKIHPLLPEINEALSTIGKARVEGSYYARTPEGDKYIVSIDGAGQFYCEPQNDTTILAKARYVGVFRG